jgi:NAD(P)H-dependent FMN reductase
MAASLKKESLNKKLISLAARIATETFKAEANVVDFSAYDLPLYNADIQDNVGFPENVSKFIADMDKVNAIIISSPEYNYSTPGTLKNLIDWVSRVRPMPWTNREILLISASPSEVGGHRGLIQTRIPLEGCGAYVHPDMFCLAKADSTFNERGNLKDSALQKRLEKTIEKFMQRVKTIKQL